MSVELAEPRLFGGESPEALVRRATEQLGPFAATVCLFSGGNDSLVTAHRCRDLYESLVFIDTGTAVPGVREFVVRAAEWLEKPLSVYGAEPGEYRRLVLGGQGLRGRYNPGVGFPGPMQHGRCYNRLKERALEAMRRDLKRERTDRILALTGVRRAESTRRRAREPITRKGSLVFCNPLIDWGTADMLAYRSEHGLIESDVAALLHRSGECNCGAYAVPGEREELRAFFPEWFHEFIVPLEHEAAAAGFESCEWGAGPNSPVAQADRRYEGELCGDCQLRIEGAA